MNTVEEGMYVVGIVVARYCKQLARITMLQSVCMANAKKRTMMLSIILEI